jgi:hypothetical protein
MDKVYVVYIVADKCKLTVIRVRVAEKKYGSVYCGRENEVNLSSGREQENKF